MSAQHDFLKAQRTMPQAHFLAATATFQQAQNQNWAWEYYLPAQLAMRAAGDAYNAACKACDEAGVK